MMKGVLPLCLVLKLVVGETCSEFDAALDNVSAAVRPVHWGGEGMWVDFSRTAHQSRSDVNHGISGSIVWTSICWQNRILLDYGAGNLRNAVFNKSRWYCLGC